ncbi:hypothetical protein HOO54_02900 [Bacillus sp. WMMC1349]|uniref:hypothetical protein n=1 Tax=Bacillus sp. WMMC1349 TaxID=2736254 RepID=UPI001553EEE8|nr:hypothetical protein [Bacillus sp. WMMC1349]NPC91228.1 hypothetical protein [Bacillus sp. WMMC1349]
MVNTINLRGRQLKTKGFKADLNGNQVVISNFDLTLDGSTHSMESVGFDLKGDSTKRILYKLYVIQANNESLTYHLARIELDANGFDFFAPPDNAIYLFSEIYVEKDNTIAGVIYNSTDEAPYSTNEDLKKLPPQFNIRIDEGIYEREDSKKERVIDVQDPRT